MIRKWASASGARKAARFRSLAVITAFALAGLGAVFTAGSAQASVITYSTLGYPNSTMPCEHSPYLATGSCANYDWGPVRNGSEASTYSSRGYGYRNCTDYVAWKLQSLGVTIAKTRGLGDGGQWYGLAPVAERTSTPAYGEAAVSNSGGYGHVAFVESVNAAAKTMVIAEYNYDKKGDGDTRTVATGPGTEFTQFVNFGLKASGSGAPRITTSACRPAPSHGPTTLTSQRRRASRHTHGSCRAVSFRAA